ncbi:MAG: glycosyltransferase family 4 protein [Phycisphaerae bacterium]|nr:glycosyltransferase family 4 protein [Phycisphaerae bacterium]
MSQTEPKATVLVVGPLPPPHHGVSLCTKLIVEYAGFADLRVLHHDTSDHRSLSTVDRIDAANILLGVGDLLTFLYLLVAERIDLIYLPLCQTRLGILRDAAFLLPARMLRKRVVLHMHGARFRAVYDTSGPLVRWLSRASLRGSAAIIVLGESLRSLFSGIVAPERIHVLPNGIEDWPAGASLPSERSLQSPTRVLYFGALTRAKGLIDALEAAAIVSKRCGPSVRFVFAGGFRYESDRVEAQSIVATRHLEDTVCFKGVLTGREKAEAFAEADLFLFLSHDEGQPLVLLEAMAAGLPIVATRVGAVPETVRHGESGLVVPPRDPSAAADALCRLVQDRRLQTSMSRRGRDLFLQCYTAGTFLDRLVRIWKSALSSTLREPCPAHPKRRPRLV